MQIIIEIPESNIPKEQDIIEIPFHFMDGKVCEAGGYGFDILPKGHGRLIDANALEDHLKEDADEWDNYALARVEDAPTIIEANREESETN